jgi:3'-phosphoadenosine 5'-phosphosulfate sulfotransferase (PAPS reductase)/FAD synthetase
MPSAIQPVLRELLLPSAPAILRRRADGPILLGAELLAGIGLAGAPPIAVDPAVLGAVQDGAWVIFSLSGGKDSAAAAFAASAWLDRIGHDRGRRLAVHADLGRAEWETTPATVAAIAAALGVELLVVRRRAGDLVARWEQRFVNAKARYEALETYHLIGPWSQANKRFCTSEHKTHVIRAALARRLAGATILSVVGIRREESAVRRATPISVRDTKAGTPTRGPGTIMLRWHPLVDWTTTQVFEAHRRFGWPLHEAYGCFGSTRLSCRFCVLASLSDLEASSRAIANADHYRHLVGMEVDSTFSFQPTRWLGDVALGLLTADLARALAAARLDAARRRAIEAAMPPELRYIKGWPPRLPTPAEAHAIAEARRPILDRHRLADRYPDADAVRARFSELLEAKATRKRR